MGFVAVFELIATLASLSLGILVYLDNPKRPVNRFFCLLSGSLLGWNGTAFIETVTASRQVALFFDKIQQVSAICLPVFFLHFVFYLISHPADKRRRKMGYAYWIGIIFLILNFTALVTSGVEPKPFFNFYTVPGPFYPLFIFYFLAIMSWGVFELFTAFRTAKGVIRNQTMYILLAALIGTPAAIINFGVVYNVGIFPLGSPVVVVYSTLIAYSIVKLRLMDIRIAVTRVGIFLTIYTLVLGVPFWVWFATKNGLLSTSLAVTFATAGPIIYRYIQHKAENVLLAQQKRYQKFLLSAAKGIMREHNLDRLLNLIVHVVKSGVKPEFVAAFLFDKEHNRYALKALRDHDMVPDSTVFPENHALIELIKSKKTILIYDQIQPFLRGMTRPGLPVQLIVPAFSEQKLLGFLALGEKVDGTIYTEDDTNVFTIVAEQAGQAIEYCLFLKEFKEAQDKIFTAERLASLGGMAAGVSHQIKNWLNNFTTTAAAMSVDLAELMLKYTDFKNKYPDVYEFFQMEDERAGDINDISGRLAGMVNRFLGYAKAGSEGFSEFSLEDLIKVVLDMMKIKYNIAAEQMPFTLETDIAGGNIQAVKSDITEVLRNIMDNAYEAIKEMRDFRLDPEDKKNYRPRIGVKSRETETGWLIEISDNGAGMKEDDKKKIFSPFFTTKASFLSGTGIGMYVVQRLIVERNHGRIWFESEFMKGTTFFIELPKEKSKES